MFRSHSCFPRFVLSGLLVLGLLLVTSQPTAAQKARPDSALLPSPNPLCDGIAVPCLDIDDLAAHVYAQLQVLPHTDQRDTAAVLPFGVALGLFGRLAGGVSTHYAFWQEGGVNYHQFGPLRFNLTLRLWPLFSRGSSGGTAPTAAAATYYTPPPGLRFGLAYEHEVRVWQFDGVNSLGLLTDLAALRFLGSRMFGPIQVSASLGALYDWQGRFATGEAAAQIGLYLPGCQALKFYVEALGRGVPTYLHTDALPPAPDGQALIHPQSLLSLGFSFHPHARVDLGVSVQRGFSGLAPWAVSLQFLTLSVGNTYDHRAVTPVVQMAADVTVESVRAIHEYIKSLPIDPVLDDRCMLWDDNGELMVQQPLGVRTADGKQCLVEGEKLPIGESWWRDRNKSVICRDKKLTDCLMYRRPREHSYRVLHRPWVGDDCVLRENVYDPAAPAVEKGRTHRTVELAVLGSLTKDRTACTDSTGLVRPVGTQYYREHGHLWICESPRIEEQRDHCFLSLTALPQKIQNQTTTVGRIARALDRGLSRKTQAIDKLPVQVVDTAEGVAEGRITASTVVGALEAKAEKMAQHTSVDSAKRWLRNKIDGAREWANKAHIEQGEDLAEEAGDAMIPHPVTAGAMIMSGGISRAGGVLNAAEKLEEVAQTGKQITRFAKAADRAEQTIVKTEIHAGKQGKHIPGHNNFTSGRSELTHPDPQGLLDRHAGTGVRHGHKEVVDFGETIGTDVSENGARAATTRGTIHYSKDGKMAHIVPAKPKTIEAKR